MIKILDTTLRDGEQTPGVRLSCAAKLEIAEQLCRLGVDIIEAGFPAASPGDFEAVSAIASAVKTATVAALCRSTVSDIDTAWRALSQARQPRLHIFLASSDIHLRDKLQMTRSEALAAVKKSVAYAKELCPDVQFSPEDATRSDRDYLCEVIRCAIDAGATTINIPDTVGYSVPAEFGELFSYIISQVCADGVVFSAHCHNDLGLAVANSLSAAASGARQIECAINGLGERAGNASLEEIVMALSVRSELFGELTNITTPELIRTSRLVSSLTGVPVPCSKAIVGANAFSHEAGIHQHGVMMNEATYEIMKPSDIGLDRNTIVLGKLSGKHAFAERVAHLGYSLDGEGIDATFARFKENADRKSNMTDDDIRAIVCEYLDGKSGKYRLESYQLQCGNHISAMAMLTLCADGESFTDTAPGGGPIDAVFHAINRISGCGDVRLEKYEIDAVTEGADALGEVKVQICAPPADKDEKKGAVYTGRGVSRDIIKASIKAYLNAVNKLLACKSD